MKLYTILLLIPAVLLPALTAWAEPSDSGNWKFVPIAAPYYTPDTGPALGAYLVAFIKEKDSSAVSELAFYSAYTSKKQAIIGMEPLLFFCGKSLLLNGKAEISRYPSLYWGTGPDTEEEAEEEYTPDEFLTDLSLLLRIHSVLYAGVCCRYRNQDMKETEDGGLLSSGHEPGSGGAEESGAGFSILLDSRNSIFYPTEGARIKADTVFHRTELSGDYNFMSAEADMRLFTCPGGNHVLAFQAKGKYTSGDVPFQSLAALGGKEIMRGYLYGRYRDRTGLSVQGEYRFPLYRRLGGVLFLASGQVQDSPGNFNKHDFHHSAGGGLRFILNREQHIAARMDLGVTEEGDLNIYIIVKEAF